MKNILTKFMIGICEVIFFLLFLTIILPLEGVQWIWEEWRGSFCPHPDGGMYAVMAEQMQARSNLARGMKRK